MSTCHMVQHSHCLQSTVSLTSTIQVSCCSMPIYSESILMVSHRQCTICRSNEHSPSGLKQTSTHSLNDYTMREWATRPQRVTQYGFKMLFSSILLVERELACPATIVVTVSNRASTLRPVCGKKVSGKNIKSAL